MVQIGVFCLKKAGKKGKKNGRDREIRTLDLLTPSQ